MTLLWLDPIPPALREKARRDFDSGDVIGFLIKAPNEYSLQIVEMNCVALKDAGLYEAALFHALVATRTNNRRYSLECLRWLIQFADRTTLLACGDPLPAEEHFTLYRGVGGRGRARRIRGVSWPASKATAQWFAERAAIFGFHDPAVYSIRIERADVYACARTARNEDEYICLLPAQCHPIRL